MPIIDVCTNVSRANIKEKCAELFANDIATVLNKPATAVAVTVRADQDMFMMGSSEPCIVLTIASVTDFSDVEFCRKVCNEATTAVFKYMDVPKDRIRVILQALQPENVGFGVEKGTLWDMRQAQKK